MLCDERSPVEQITGSYARVASFKLCICLCLTDLFFSFLLRLDRGVRR